MIQYLLLPRTFFPFSIPSRASFSRHFLVSQRLSQFLFLFFINFSFIRLSPTLSSTPDLFILSVHFRRSTLSISTSQMLPVVFAQSVIVSKSLDHKTLHSRGSTSLASSLVLFRGPQQMLLFLLKASFAITILCFTS